MSDLSFAEFVVYEFIALFSLCMLISSINKDVEVTRILSVARSIYMVPGIIASGIIASSGININLNSVFTNNLIKSINTTQTWTETTSQGNFIILQNPVWLSFHYMIFAVLLFYVVFQVLNLMQSIFRPKNIDQK